MSRNILGTKKNKPSAAARRQARVKAAFDPEALKRICTQTDFSMYAPKIDLPPDDRHWRGLGNDRFYYYRDNGATVLAVAHLDHVQEDGTCNIVPTLDGPLALSGALDDRLGAYVILELLPKLGIKVDWLLTTNEEMGASTARDFFIDHKQYNWLIEFDRGGTDVVMYDYENDETRSLVKAAGARVGSGSYSDIADLEHLDCAGFNWGVGYYDYHSKRSHAWLNDTFEMVAKFMRFYSANASKHIAYAPEYRRWSAGDINWGSISNSASSDPVTKCPECKSDLSKWGECWGCGYDADVAEVQGQLSAREALSSCHDTVDNTLDTAVDQ